MSLLPEKRYEFGVFAIDAPKLELFRAPDGISEQRHVVSVACKISLHSHTLFTVHPWCYSSTPRTIESVLEVRNADVDRRGTARSNGAGPVSRPRLAQSAGFVQTPHNSKTSAIDSAR